LSFANFKKADLSNGKFRAGVFICADLENAYLSNADLTPDTFDATPTWVKILGGLSYGISAAYGNYSPLTSNSNPKIYPAILFASNLKNTNLTSALLKGANLNEADLSQANLTGANLVTTNFLNSNLANANLTKATATSTNFQSANLSQSNLNDANLNDAYLVNSNLSQANLKQTLLTNINMTGANLKDAKIQNTNLDSSRFCNTTMADGSIRESKCSENYPKMVNSRQKICSIKSFARTEVLENTMLSQKDKKFSETNPIILPNSPEFYELQAQTYQLNEDYKKAIASYDQLIQLKPDSALAYNNRGSAFAALGNPQSAIQDYRQALKLDPKLPIVYLNLGYLYARLLDKTKADNNYQQVLDLDPKIANKAYKSILEENKLDPSLAMIMVYLDRGYANLGLDKKDEAIQEFDKAIALNPNYAYLYVSRGMAKINNDKSSALEDVNQAIRLAPHYSYAYEQRGLIKKEQGKKTEAIKDLQKAIELYRQDNKTDKVNELEIAITNLNLDL